MRLRTKRTDEAEEGESYYVSMTDLMVGVLFIFIIMLCYFALNYHRTTASLTASADPRTDLLLKQATDLQKRDATLEVDEAHAIVCVPGGVLNGKDEARHCFAYGKADAAPPSDVAAARGMADQAAFMSDLDAVTHTAPVAPSTSIDGGEMSFDADTLFAPGTSDLSGDGRATAQQVAVALAKKLPCYGFGVPVQGCVNAVKMSVVNVTASVTMDAATPQGRAAQALALERAVAFRAALIAAQPALGQVLNLPPGQSGSQALLQVASVGQSAAQASGAGGRIAMQFRMAAN